MSGVTELKVLYEDRHLIVCEKPIGVSCEEGEQSVPALIRAHWGKTDAYVGTVHRLDTGVGGVMVYAKTNAAAASLSKQIQERTFEKEYRCICVGIPEPSKGEMRDFLFKDSKKGKVFPVKGARKGAKEAILEYEVLKSGEVSADTSASLCRVILHTGRTHQIRVQFASRKHSLLGDGKYGSRIKGDIALRCVRIAFTHPKDGRRMSFESQAGAEWILQENG